MRKANEEDEKERMIAGSNVPGAADHHTEAHTPVGPEPDVQLVTRNAAMPTRITFPDAFFETARHHHVFPLAFFYPPTAEKVISKIHLYRQSRVPGLTTKTYVINIEDIVKKLKDEKGSVRSKMKIFD